MSSFVTGLVTGLHRFWSPARGGGFARWRLAMLWLLLCLCGATHAQTLRVMSLNVRLPVAADGEDRWEARRDQMVDMLRRTRPDLIGTQELFGAQGAALVEALPEYAWFGRGRRGGDADDEHMGVFYRKNRLKLKEQGQFWLSETPGVPASQSRSVEVVSSFGATPRSDARPWASG